jgi:hypothetical protein
MDSLGELLIKKATAIQLDEKLQEIYLAQKELERFFDNSQARVSLISHKTVTINVRSAAIASEVKFSQVNLLESLTKTLQRQISRLYIKSGQI